MSDEMSEGGERGGGERGRRGGGGGKLVTEGPAADADGGAAAARRRVMSTITDGASRSAGAIYRCAPHPKTAGGSKDAG